MGLLFSVPVFAQSVISFGGTYRDDTTHVGVNYYNFTENGLFLQANYYTSLSNDSDASFASVDFGYTGNRDTLPSTVYVGLTQHSCKPDLNVGSDIVPRIGFWFGSTDSKWKIGASAGRQIFHNGSDPLYAEFSVMMFDFFYPRKTNYVVNLRLRFFKDQSTALLWEFGTAL